MRLQHTTPSMAAYKRALRAKEEPIATLDIARIRDMQCDAEILADRAGRNFTAIMWGYFNGSSVYRCLPVFNSWDQRILRRA